MLPRIPKKLPRETKDLIKKTVQTSPKKGELGERLRAMPPELRRTTVAAFGNYIARTLSELKRTRADLREFDIIHIATVVDAVLGIADGEAVAKVLRARTHEQVSPPSQEDEGKALYEFIRSRPALAAALSERLERSDDKRHRRSTRSRSSRAATR